MKNLKSLIVNLPEDVERYMVYGDFNRANELIDIYMKRNISKLLKQRLEYEKYRIGILKNEYVYSFEEALDRASKKIKDFSEQELEKLKDDRIVDWIYIDGKVMFNKRFLETIIAVCDDISCRLIEEPKKNKKKNEVLDKVINEIIEKREKRYFIHVKTGIKLNKEACRKGEKIRVHLPIPKPSMQIENIKILKTNPECKFISGEDCEQRTIYFEKEIEGEDEFTVEYCFENFIKYNSLDYTRVSKIQPDFYTNELPPHIVFTPFLVDLAKEIVGNEKNPLLKARKIYNYITQNVQYSYMRQYAGIVNIPEYAAYNLKGDCGVQALLFITLCRIVGIPARWQSGLYVNPYFVGCHDWAQFYIQPYGWLFADLSFGGSAYRKENIKRWNFYFGNVDTFRMVANSDFQGEFVPEKKFFRIDPYDNQCGEAEYLDKGLSSEDFKRIMEIIDIHEK
ncbi:transglutaminase-like domain-containing protein [Haloimpatiens sp. FM7330]|uniref:transglutaminase-like domain-containing protein n=1 Tax=Haloimpatiens sp. FM7330 TaxID=3298610 RepID=UPI0036456DD6